MNKNNIKHALNTALAFSLVSIQAIATADDTAVFLSKNSKPNLLFIMDMSGSMKWGVSASGYDPKTGIIDEGNPPSRSDVMKNAVKRVLKQAPDEINIGLMSYGQGTFDGQNSRLGWNENYRSHGVHGVSFPIKGINELKELEELKELKRGATGGGPTPGPPTQRPQLNSFVFFYSFNSLRNYKN